MLAQSLLTFKYVYSNFLLRIYHLLKKKHKDTHRSCLHVAILKLHTHTHTHTHYTFSSFCCPEDVPFQKIIPLQRTCYFSLRTQ